MTIPAVSTLHTGQLIKISTILRPYLSRAMEDQSVTVEEKVRLLRACVKKHQVFSYFGVLIEYFRNHNQVSIFRCCTRTV